MTNAAVAENPFAVFPEIETERLVLREILPDDSEAIFRIFSDDKVILSPILRWRKRAI
jgi:RimJ/RimL family protein N-acetyltransferase